MGVEFLPHVPKYQQVAYVYAIFCVEGDFGYLKIGYSIEPLKRVSSIAGGSPFTPDRIGVVKMVSQRSAFGLEQGLHHSLHKRRVAQEWFKYDLKDVKQKEEFDKFSMGGFGPAWQTFPFAALKEMNRQESLKKFHASQKAKRTRSNSYDRHWMDGTKGCGNESRWMPKGRK